MTFRERVLCDATSSSTSNRLRCSRAQRAPNEPTHGPNRRSLPTVRPLARANQAHTLTHPPHGASTRAPRARAHPQAPMAKQARYGHDDRAQSYPPGRTAAVPGERRRRAAAVCGPLAETPRTSARLARAPPEPAHARLPRRSRVTLGTRSTRARLGRVATRSSYSWPSATPWLSARNAGECLCPLGPLGDAGARARPSASWLCLRAARYGPVPSLSLNPHALLPAPVLRRGGARADVHDQASGSRRRSRRRGASQVRAR